MQSTHQCRVVGILDWLERFRWRDAVLVARLPRRNNQVILVLQADRPRCTVSHPRFQGLRSIEAGMIEGRGVCVLTSRPYARTKTCSRRRQACLRTIFTCYCTMSLGSFVSVMPFAGHWELPCKLHKRHSVTKHQKGVCSE